jgi:hypothetical protein
MMVMGCWEFGRVWRRGRGAPVISFTFFHESLVALSWGARVFQGIVF